MRIKFSAKDVARLTGRGGASTRTRPALRKPPAPKESEVQRAVVAVLAAGGCLVVRVNGGLLPRADGGRMRCSAATVGTCVDVLALTPGGVWLALEIKRPGGKPPTPGQLAFLAAVRARGGVGEVVRSAEEAELVLAGCV